MWSRPTRAPLASVVHVLALTQSPDPHELETEVVSFTVIPAIGIAEPLTSRTLYWICASHPAPLHAIAVLLLTTFKNPGFWTVAPVLGAGGPPGQEPGPQYWPV